MILFTFVFIVRLHVSYSYIRSLCLRRESFYEKKSWQRNKFSIGLFTMHVYGLIFRLLFTIVEVIYPYNWCLKKDFLEFVICWCGKLQSLHHCNNSIIDDHFLCPYSEWAYHFLLDAKRSFWFFVLISYFVAKQNIWMKIYWFYNMQQFNVY